MTPSANSTHNVFGVLRLYACVRTGEGVCVCVCKAYACVGELVFILVHLHVEGLREYVVDICKIVFIVFGARFCCGLTIRV